jgi:hypothetical protein
MSADFDKAIDDAVREMLAVEPPADLRERVIGRLPAAGFRLPAFGFRLPASGWVLGSMAAVAIIVLAVFVVRRGEPVPPQASVFARAVDRHLPSELRARPTAPAISSSAPSARPVVSVSVPGGLTRGGGVQATSVPDADSSAALAPLPSITPISVMPIVESRIAPPEIAVRSLTPISEMQIAPLTPPDRR